jgi:hypothetical protein
MTEKVIIANKRKAGGWLAPGRGRRAALRKAK